MAGITVKPTISGLEFEFNASEIQQSDGSDVVQWDDLSGNGHHGIGAGSVGLPVLESTGFNNLPCVRLTGDERHFEIWGAGDNPFVGTDLTWFAVIEATDISSHLAVIGSASSSTPPRVPDIFIKSDGTIIAGFQWGPSSGGDVASSAGEISDGDKLIITFRHSGTDGKLLRVNGVELDESTGSTSHLVTSQGTNGTIGRNKNDFYPGVPTIYGADRRFAWLSGYTSAATLQQMIDMECYLGTLFKVYTISCPPPDPVVANLQIETVLSIELELPQKMEMRLQLEQTITEDVDA